MGIGVAIFLIAVGAILRFAIDIQNTSGVDLHMIGVILMTVGLFGALLSMMFWSSWGGWNRGADRDVVVDGDRPRRTVVVEQERRV